MSSRYTMLRLIPHVSPAYVIAATMFVSVLPAPRKLGPPESPWLLPPKPKTVFWLSLSRSGFSAVKPSVAYRLVPRPCLSQIDVPDEQPTVLTSRGFYGRT